MLPFNAWLQEIQIPTKSYLNACSQNAPLGSPRADTLNRYGTTLIDSYEKICKEGKNGNLYDFSKNNPIPTAGMDDARVKQIANEMRECADSRRKYMQTCIPPNERDSGHAYQIKHMNKSADKYEAALQRRRQVRQAAKPPVRSAWGKPK